MVSAARVIQGLIVFSTVLGVFFLWQAHPLLPGDVFDILAFGWLLFVVDSVLTLVRPRISYYLGLVLAVIALSETLTQPEHYALVENGNVPATVILVLGSVAQALLIGSVIWFVISERRKDPWEWPGVESQA
ncbi:MAG TPA: hypothetical protein VLY82_03000 [Nitrososphaerales archaeon]|nr:hypothetical protein [Nitrososphaerales archaeon]